MQHSERAGEASIVQEAIAMLASIGAFGPAHVDTAEEEARRLLERATTVNARTAVYRALGRLAAICGRFDEARELMLRGREPLLDSGLVVYHAATCLSAAFVEEHAGDYEAAIRIHREGFDRLTELGEHAFSSTVAAGLARAFMRLEQQNEVERWLRRAHDLCPPGDIATLAIADTVAGLLHASRGELDDAERLVKLGLEQAETTDFWEFRGEAYEALAEVLAARGRRDQARAALEQALDVYRAKGARIAEERALALLAQL